jgi:hypothetical protein
MACTGEWHPPKTDYSPLLHEGVTGEDLNEIGCDLLVLYNNANVPVAEVYMEPKVDGDSLEYGPGNLNPNKASLYKSTNRVDFVCQQGVSMWRVDGRTGALEFEIPTGMPLNTKPNSGIFTTVILNTSAPSIQDDVRLEAAIGVVSVDAEFWYGKIVFYVFQAEIELFSSSSIGGVDTAFMPQFQFSWWVEDLLLEE